MVHKLFVVFIVLVAVIVGLLNITPFHPDVVRLAMFSEFFSAALPILAFGALVKYLCSCCKGRCGNAACCTRCGNAACTCK